MREATGISIELVRQSSNWQICAADGQFETSEKTRDGEVD
jgi:hypothetical protein